MAYVYDGGRGQSLYLDNSGNQTIVTIVTSSPGQQQQASSSWQTGAWTEPPSLHPLPGGALLRIVTNQGEYLIQVQGSQMQVISDRPPAASFQPMQFQAAPPTTSMPGMQPMQPMQPMTMGNMQMSLEPMEMRMGNMELRMGTAPPAPATTRRFCSQCGAAVKPDDRFCASCGHALT